MALFVSLNASGKQFEGRGLWLETTVHSSPGSIILSRQEGRGTELRSDPLASPLRPGTLESSFRKPFQLSLCVQMSRTFPLTPDPFHNVPNVSRVSPPWEQPPAKQETEQHGHVGEGTFDGEVEIHWNAAGLLILMHNQSFSFATNCAGNHEKN